MLNPETFVWTDAGQVNHTCTDYTKISPQDLLTQGDTLLDRMGGCDPSVPFNGGWFAYDHVQLVDGGIMQEPAMGGKQDEPDVDLHFVSSRALIDELLSRQEAMIYAGKPKNEIGVVDERTSGCGSACMGMALMLLVRMVILRIKEG